jgi:hypothetical protein
MIDLKELEIELVEVPLRKGDYEKRVVRLVKLLLEIDQSAEQDQDDSPIEVAA